MPRSSDMHRRRFRSNGDASGNPFGKAAPQDKIAEARTGSRVCVVIRHAVFRPATRHVMV